MLVLEVLEDDGGIEDAGVAVDQRRHLETQACRGERTGRFARAQALRCFDLERETLFAQRDLDLLRVRRERMFVEQHHGNSSFTSTAALAITAGSLFSGSS